jgi:hypothetical protein
LQEWLQHAEANTPVPIIDADGGVADLTIYSDASAWGAGAIAIYGDGRVQTFSAPWSDEERATYRVEHSAVAEPLAVVKAVRRFVSPAIHSTVDIFSDHVGFVFAARAGHGRTSSYNTAIAQLHAGGFSDVQFRVEFVPGLKNPADPFSRGVTSSTPSVRVGYRSDVPSRPVSCGGG